MTADLAYSHNQIKELVSGMSALFDVVRLVDPVSMTSYSLEGNELVANPSSCYSVWGRTDRCENCVSARCLAEGARYTKFEFADQDVFHVVAQPVQVEGNRYALEVATQSNDRVLLSAFGKNDFVERITAHNHALYVDQLTGLANRSFLNDRLGILMERSRRAGKPLAVVMTDFDDLKSINDSLGHLVGDQALTQAAQNLRAALAPQEEDLLVRYGGDEMLAVLYDVDEAALRTRLAAVEPIALPNGCMASLSIGAVCRVCEQGEDALGLIDQADAAMYAIKGAGKNGFGFALAR